MRVILIPFVLAFAACAPTAPLEEIGTIPDASPEQTAPVADSGLEEREPDLCQRAEHQQYLGQDASVLQGIAINRAFRVIAPGDIVTQEYDPGRLNFRLGQRNEIVDIDCG